MQLFSPSFRKSPAQGLLALESHEFLLNSLTGLPQSNILAPALQQEPFGSQDLTHCPQVEPVTMARCPTLVKWELVHGTSSKWELLKEPSLQKS